MTAKMAMVLAAGLGKRMRPLTERMPKPLVPVAGRALIDYALDSLEAVGVERAVVNIHHLGDQLRAHMAKRRRLEILISDETEMLLDSGGGVVKALPWLGAEPFLLLNSDTFWIEDERQAQTNLQRLMAGFAADRMDIRLMTARLDQTTGHSGGLDFDLAADGQLVRHRGESAGKTGDPVIYAGAAMLQPHVFDDAPAGPFSLNRCFDAAIASNRLYGMPMHGHWITVGTPDAIGAAEAAMAGWHAGSHETEPGRMAVGWGPA